MGVHSIHSVQNIPAPLEQVWDFFSNSANLGIITPPQLAFRTISTDHGDRIYEGQVIEYIIKPLLGISVRWKTRIIKVEDCKMFIDTQLRGPYRLWIHRHDFRRVEGGTEMMDTVQYQLPMGFVGALMHEWVVKKKLLEIFQFRYEKIGELFGVWPDQKMRVTLGGR